MNDFDNGYRQKNNCPYCNKFSDRPTCLEDFKQIPSPGDFSICFGCTEVSIYDEKMNLIKIDVSTLDFEDVRNIHKIQFNLQNIKQKHKFRKHNE